MIARRHNLVACCATVVAGVLAVVASVLAVGAAWMPGATETAAASARSPFVGASIGHPAPSPAATGTATTAESDSVSRYSRIVEQVFAGPSVPQPGDTPWAARGNESAFSEVGERPPLV